MKNNITSIAVCGAGTMGNGIAQVCLQAGYNTILFDVDAQMLLKARAGVEKGLQILVEKNKLTEEKKNLLLKNIIYVSDINQCKADVIIEAIVEKEEIKVALFNKLAELNSQYTIFATNTSSLSVNSIQEKIISPERLLGMHFFNPAPLMKLVEIIKGVKTSDEVFQVVFELTKQMNKVPVSCIDSPGFIVNRVARPYYLEAMKLVELGIANYETVDQIMEATRFKMGPFKLMDLIGMDINYSVSNIVWEAMDKPDRLRPSDLQREKVAENKLGRKTNEGFYKYPVPIR